MTIEPIALPTPYTVAGLGPYTIDWPYISGAVVVQIETDTGFVTLAEEDLTLDPPMATVAGDLYLSAEAAAEYAGSTLWISRNTPVEQGWLGTAPREKSLEAGLDLLTMALQDSAAASAGAVRVLGATLPPTIPTADSALVWNEDGTAVVAGPTVDQIGAAQGYAEATAADRVQTGLDRTATAADRVQTGLDRTATAADRVQTGLDRTATAADAVATAADRVQTGLDRTATAADRVQTGLDRTATAADRVQTGLDRVATEAAAEQAIALSLPYTETDAAIAIVTVPAGAKVITRLPTTESAGQVAPVGLLTWWKRTIPPTSEPYFTTAGGVVWTQTALREQDVLSTLQSAIAAAFTDPSFAGVQPFANRAAFLAATIPAPVIRTAFVVNGRAYPVIRDAAGAITQSDGTKWRPDGHPTPYHFNATGLGVDSDRAAFIAMFASVAGGGNVDIPKGDYMFDGPVPFVGTGIAVKCSPDARFLRAGDWADTSGTFGNNIFVAYAGTPTKVADYVDSNAEMDRFFWDGGQAVNTVEMTVPGSAFVFVAPRRGGWSNILQDSSFYGITGVGVTDCIVENTRAFGSHTVMTTTRGNLTAAYRYKFSVGTYRNTTVRHKSVWAGGTFPPNAAKGYARNMELHSADGVWFDSGCYFGNAAVENFELDNRPPAGASVSDKTACLCVGIFLDTVWLDYATGLVIRCANDIRTVADVQLKGGRFYGFAGFGKHWIKSETTRLQKLQVIGGLANECLKSAIEIEGGDNILISGTELSANNLSGVSPEYDLVVNRAGVTGAAKNATITGNKLLSTGTYGAMWIGGGTEGQLIVTGNDVSGASGPATDTARIRIDDPTAFETVHVYINAPLGSGISTGLLADTAGKLVGVGHYGIGRSILLTGAETLQSRDLPAGAYSYAADVVTGGPEAAAWVHSLIITDTDPSLTGATRRRKWLVSRVTTTAANMKSWEGYSSGTGAITWTETLNGNRAAGLGNHADDAAAAAASVPIGGWYRTGSIIKVRIT